MAIDRKTITARIMDGMATPAPQFMPDGMFGAPPKAEEIKYDPEGAKKLLAEAGYPNGFELTISSTNDRYVNDGQVAQAVAQYLSRIGIKTTVDAMTASIYFRAPSANSASRWAAGRRKRARLRRCSSCGWPRWIRPTAWAPATTAASPTPISTGHKQAIVTVDAPKREALLQQSTKIALDNVPLIPLHFESSIWAFRKGISYEGRRDQFTLATSVKPDAK